MKTFKDLDHIFKMTVKWEQGIKDLYDIASYGLKNEKSKEFVSFLNKNQLANMKVLNNLNLNDYGPIEWVQFAKDSHVEDEIPVQKLGKGTPPLVIFRNVIQYEEKLKKFYAKIASALVSESQTELFESLSQFKENQIESIKNFLKRNYETDEGE